MEKREFYVLVITTDGNDGFFVGEANPDQKLRVRVKVRLLDELMENMRKAIESCLQNDDEDSLSEIIGIYKIEV